VSWRIAKAGTTGDRQKPNARDQRARKTDVGGNWLHSRGESEQSQMRSQRERLKDLKHFSANERALLGVEVVVFS
jgi:hypothetical protein